MSASMTPAEMRAYLEAAPLPGDGPPIYERDDLALTYEEDQKGEKPSGYEMCGRSLAHAFLVLCEETPELLDVPSREDDPTGVERAHNDRLWQAFTDRWPDGTSWLGDPTGFQFGWSHNAVRYVLGRETVGNPAVMTIGKAARS